MICFVFRGKEKTLHCAFSVVQGKKRISSAFVSDVVAVAPVVIIIAVLIIAVVVVDVVVVYCRNCYCSAVAVVVVVNLDLLGDKKSKSESIILVIDGN